jgi:hypothetical protein
MQNYYLDLFNYVIKRKSGQKSLNLNFLFFLVTFITAYKKKQYMKNIQKKIPDIVKNKISSNNDKNNTKSIGFNDHCYFLRKCQEEDNNTYHTILIYALILITRIVMTTKLMNELSNVIKHLTDKNWKGMFQAQIYFSLLCFRYIEVEFS